MEPDVNRDFTEIQIPVPWGTIAGRWYGDQSVRPILLIHGRLDNCGSFAKLAPLLVPHASLLCIDLPGHGYSSHLPPGIPYFNLDFVRVILRLMNEYNWQKVSLIGHSLGAAVAFDFAAIHPKRVDILIGIDVIRRHYLEHDKYIDDLHYCYDRALIENDRIMAQSKTIEPPSYTLEECEKRLYEGSDQSVTLENCKYILERNIAKSQKYPNRYYFSRDGRLKLLTDWNPSLPLRRQLAIRICQQSIPYLVIKAGATMHINKQSEIIDIMRLHNPYFEMHEIAGATHHLHLNNPEVVAELIKGFLQKYRPLNKIRLEDQFLLTDKAKL